MENLLLRARSDRIEHSVQIEDRYLGSFLLCALRLALCVMGTAQSRVLHRMARSSMGPNLAIFRVQLCQTGVTKELRHGLGNDLAILVRHFNKVNSHPKCQNLPRPNHLSGNSKGWSGWRLDR
jgi:hypothetical protein